MYDGRPVAQRTEYGVVESMQLYRGGSVRPSDSGRSRRHPGGVIGHQFGGAGNTAATIAGAIGGAVVGNQVERAKNAIGIA